MDRPVLKLKLKPVDWLLEVLSTLVISIIIAFAFIIHRHYFSGNRLIVKHAEKRFSSVMIFVFMSVFLFVMLTLLAKIPHTFNYPVAITAENAEREYRLGLRILRSVKLFILSVMLILVASLQ
jgi:hypothetical protein